MQWGNRALNCITHSFSRASPPGGTRGELVDIGTGTEQDFVRHDLRGKIALIQGLAMPPAARRATLAGAIGHVHISPDEHLHEMCISPGWGSPSLATGIATRRGRGASRGGRRCSEIPCRGRRRDADVHTELLPDGGVRRYDRRHAGWVAIE